MKVSRVAKLSPTARLLYWMRERHNIHLRKLKGLPRPWTDDDVLQQYFFTNPYRENDKTTVWFRTHLRDPLRNWSKVLMATVIFRWFNFIPTGQELLRWKGQTYGSFVDWDGDRVAQYLEHRANEYNAKIFTGAYMIKAGNGPPGCKIRNVCEAIDRVWLERKRLVALCARDRRLQALWEALRQFRFLGKFMSYEVVCDLRYTYLLRKATDVDTWANPGPGAQRGLMRMRGRMPELTRKGRIRRSFKLDDPVGQMQKLLQVARKKLIGMPRLELREIEHSLCEWDKYERARTGEGGRMKRKYDGCA